MESPDLEYQQTLYALHYSYRNGDLHLTWQYTTVCNQTQDAFTAVHDWIYPQNHPRRGQFHPISPLVLIHSRLLTEHEVEAMPFNTQVL